MKKEEFINLIAEHNNIDKNEATKVVKIFTESVIAALSEQKNISLIGFGQFAVSDIPARDGRNPSTGKPIKVAAYKQPKFKAGQKLKDACNK